MTLSVLCPKFCSSRSRFRILAHWCMTTKRNVIFNRTCTFTSLLRGRARGLDIDRLRSLNSAINDCVHRLRGSRSNEYDERVAALGERAVHTDLRLIDWTPFHSTTLRHRGSSPPPPRIHPMSEPTSLILSQTSGWCSGTSMTNRN